MNKEDLIIVIVDKYKEEKVLKKALDCGAESGVIINGRGTGSLEKLKFLGIDIEPEKRVVLLVTQNSYSEVILEELNKELNLEGINKGIAFVLPIKEAIGMETK